MISFTPYWVSEPEENQIFAMQSPQTLHSAYHLNFLLPFLSVIRAQGGDRAADFIRDVLFVRTNGTQKSRLSKRQLSAAARHPVFSL